MPGKGGTGSLAEAQEIGRSGRWAIQDRRAPRERLPFRPRLIGIGPRELPIEGRSAPQLSTTIPVAEGRFRQPPKGGRSGHDAQMKAKHAEIIERLHLAMNRHDLKAFLDCFDPSYRSEQPIHPNRGFGGREQVEKNWSAMFEGMPDFHAELLADATEGDTVWAEWHWTGTRANEVPLDMRGVTLFEIKNGQIVSGRLYMEEVEEAGADIGETVRRLAQGDRLEGE